MQKRKLGKSDLEFAPIAFGGNVFGWTADEGTSHQLLDAFVDAGFSFVDTADVYSRWFPGNKGGESETVIGTWLKKDPSKREKIVLATKCGMGLPSGALSAKNIRESVDASLKRLNTDRIDLFQSHKDDKDTPQEETLSTYGELIKAGKLRVIGASNFEAPRLAEAAKISREKGLPRYESLQPLYNLMDRAAYEADLEPLCRAEQLGVINFYALARGFLTGKYRSEADLGKSTRGGGIKAYLNPRGQRVLAALDAAAQTHSATPAQVALAWQIARPGLTAPICSATSTAQWAELAGAARLDLSPATIAALNMASAEA